MVLGAGSVMGVLGAGSVQTWCWVPGRCGVVLGGKGGEGGAALGASNNWASAIFDILDSRNVVFLCPNL